jgi:two-component system sensor histidine kinase AtoS
VLFDYELLENVLLNLSFNAIYEIRGQGIITFITFYDKSNKKLLISVKDNGPGITEDIGNQIFKPFFTTHTKGTGLGLAISKDIIDKHNGDILYSNNEDAGCTFFISLPVVSH